MGEVDHDGLLGVWDVGAFWYVDCRFGWQPSTKLP